MPHTWDEDRESLPVVVEYQVFTDQLIDDKVLVGRLGRRDHLGKGHESAC